MSKTWSQFLFLMLAIIAGALLWWQQTFSHLNLSALKTLPDVTLYDVIGVTMNSQGSPEYYLETPKITHYMNTKTTHFKNPIIQIADNKQQVWQINAKSAEADSNFSSIQLINDVRINQLSGDSADRTQILTSSLTLLPRAKIATNNEDVTVMQNTNSLRGKGLHIDLNSGLTALHSNVQATYAIN